MTPQTGAGLSHGEVGSPASPDDQQIADALALVRSVGWVTLREKSYRQAQERQRVTEARAHWEREVAEHARSWARNCLDEERRLRDRLTFVYGVAKARGATDEDLRGEA